VDVLITGATGFIGTHVRRQLAGKHRVFAVTRQLNPPSGDVVTWISANLADRDIALRLPAHVDTVVYLAQGRRYREFPEGVWDVFDANVLGLMSILEYARHHDVSRFILASTANVYRRSDEYITEDAVTEPRTFYARSKRAAELLLAAYADLFRCVVLRLFTVYGPGQRGALIPSLIGRVRSRRAIQIEGQEGLKVSPIFLADVSAVIQAVLEHDAGTVGLDIFNVGGDETTTVLSLGGLIGHMLQTVPEFEFAPGEPSGWVADTSKLKRAVGLQSFVTLEEGLWHTIAAGGA
jgi:nucleoside-diphosphate-sugar epimerase